MEDPEITKLRGRLNAHREILIELTSLFMAERGHVPAGAQGGPGEDLAIYDQEEDPGVIPTDGYAEQAEYASEARAIFNAARARMEAKSRES